MQYVTLSNGVKMPQLGYGVYQVNKEECERCVLDALKVGYRHIDTAQSYFNEEEVGNAIAKSGVPPRTDFPYHKGLGGTLRIRRNEKIGTRIYAQTQNQLYRPRAFAPAVLGLLRSVARS